MSFFATIKPSPIDDKQSRLMQLAAVFLLLYSIVQTLTPAARMQSWNVEYRWNHWIGYVVWLIGAAVVHHQMIQRLPERDPYLFPIIALLSGWGLLMIWRLDWVMGARQTAWFAICMLVFIIGMRVSNLLGFLRRYKYLWLTCGLLLTALTFLFGTYPGGFGPRLWLGCCGVYLQPSEPLKLLLITYLAAYLADRLPLSFNLIQLLTPTLILVGLALAMLLRQRDLGTASLFILIYTVIVYLASRRWRLLLGSSLLLMLAGITGYVMFDVVRIRVDAWLNPWLDPAGRSYQIVQSLMAAASGGILGRGPGLGLPGVVPVAHSDFIFAAITEETGLLGALALLMLYALLVGRGMRTAMGASNNYQRFLAAGLTAYLVMQAILIIGGNLRMLPLTGVTLPFVSYGGSSLLTATFSALLLVLVSTPGEDEPAPFPHPGPYYLVSAGLLIGLASLALVTGWWTVVRSDEILARTDNPRRSINDRYAMRGSLVDRNDIPLSHTTGDSGSLQRVYDYPPLSTTTGYNSPLYGQGGLEAALDDYLRGLRGNPSSMIWSSHLLFGQPPKGLDVRLTIDLTLQKQADELLGNRKGALVLLNADTGEILAIASHPYFDANQLDNTWPDLVQDPDAPLVNRATQGQYPAGAALSPFLLAYLEAQGQQPPSDPQGAGNCAVPLTGRSSTIEDRVSHGCSGSLASLQNVINAGDTQRLLNDLGFFTPLALPVETGEVTNPAPDPNGEQPLDEITVSPLQMTLAAASLSRQGVQPTPHLAAAVLTPEQGWVELPGGSGRETLLAGGADKTASDLAQKEGPWWQTLATQASANGELGEVTWFVGGTTAEWTGTPLAVAVVLEENNPELAEQIGQALLQPEQP